MRNKCICINLFQFSLNSLLLFYVQCYVFIRFHGKILKTEKLSRKTKRWVFFIHPLDWKVAHISGWYKITSTYPTYCTDLTFWHDLMTSCLPAWYWRIPQVRHKVDCSPQTAAWTSGSGQRPWMISKNLHKKWLDMKYLLWNKISHRRWKFNMSNFWHQYQKATISRTQR